MAELRLPLPVALPTPGAVVGAGRSFAGWCADLVDVAGRLPSRVDAALDEVTRLLAALSSVAERVDVLVVRAEGIADDIDGVLGSARRVSAGAEDVVASARSLTSGAAEVVESARGITAGADDVVGSARKITVGADEVVAGARSITSGAAEVVESARGITGGAAEVVESARGITGGAAEVVDDVSTTSRAAAGLLELYRPPLERGAPLAQHFVDELSPGEVDAAIRLVDQLPRLTDHMVTDIMPILETFDRVGPDLHELLSTTKELRQAIDGIPGLGFLKKRGAAKDDDPDPDDRS